METKASLTIVSVSVCVCVCGRGGGGGFQPQCKWAAYFSDFGSFFMGVISQILSTFPPVHSLSVTPPSRGLG